MRVSVEPVSTCFPSFSNNSNYTKPKAKHALSSDGSVLVSADSQFVEFRSVDSGAVVSRIRSCLCLSLSSKVVDSKVDSKVDALALASRVPVPGSSSSCDCDGKGGVVKVAVAVKDVVCVCERSLAATSDSEVWTTLFKADYIVSILVFDESASVLAAASSADIIVAFIESKESTTLKGHLANVTALSFVTENADTFLLSAAEDRTYKIWNISKQTCIYNSFVISAYPISAFSLSPPSAVGRRVLVVATEDGNLHLHEVMLHPSLQVRTLKIVKASSFFPSSSTKPTSPPPLPPIISSLPKWKQEQQPTNLSQHDPTLIAETSSTCTYLSHFTLPTLTPPNLKSPPLQKTILLLATQTSITLLDTSSFHPIHTQPLHTPGFLSILSTTHLTSTPASQKTRTHTFDILVQERITSTLKMFTVSISVGAGSMIPQWDSGVDLFEVAMEDALGLLDVLDETGDVELSGVVRRLVLGECQTNSGGGGSAEGSSSSSSGNMWMEKRFQSVMRELAGMGITDLKGLSSGTEDGVARRTEFMKEGSGVSVISKSVKEGILRVVDGLYGGPVANVTAGLRFRVDDAVFGGVELKKPSPSGKKTSTSTSSKKTVNPMNQPVTFRKTVKSSGYTQEPIATKLFHLPKIPSSSSSSKQKTRLSISSSSSASTTTPNFWLDSPEPMSLTLTPPNNAPIKTFIHPGAITHLNFNTPTTKLAVGCVKKSAFVTTLSTSTIKPFTSHETAVTHVHWGDPSTFLSTSTDGRVRMWDTGSTDPLLTFGPPQKPNPLSTSKTVNPSPPPSSPVTDSFNQAQFYFHSKFVLASGGARGLAMLSYKIECAGDVKPGLNYNRVSVRRRIEFDSSVVCFDAPNRVSSYTGVVVTSGSGGGSESDGRGRGRGCIVDLKEGVVCARFGVSKGVHTVVVPNGEDVRRDLFLTAGTSDLIRVWDLRMVGEGGGCGGGSVLQLLGHVNRALKVQCAMSPCGTYVVTGSEDKQAVLYDVRMGGGVLGRIKEGIKEGVLAVGFGSSRGIVGVGCADGKCLVYKV